MVKSHVKVFVRVRSAVDPSSSPVRVLPDGGSLTVTPPRTAEGVKTNPDAAMGFKFDGVLEGSDQERMYAECAAEAVENVLAGYNSTILCYGQTGAGKTYSMAGEARQYTRRGIIPRALQQIFREVDARVDKQIIVRMSYLEIYNEAMYDLLAEEAGCGDALQVVGDGSRLAVKGLRVVEASSEEEALSHIFTAELGRSTAQHAMNGASSRSHAVLTVHVAVRSGADAVERALTSKLTLVDLAGSERTKKTGVTGRAMTEANYINKSLTFLEQTVAALTRREAHVPFRSSKLTSVLRDSLGGNCKTTMIANIWGEAAHVEQTISTLRFAGRVKLIETDAVMNESTDPAFLVKKYERQVRELKAELAMRDVLAGRTPVTYGDLSPGEEAEMQRVASRYLRGEVGDAELPVDTLKHIREFYRALKDAGIGMATTAPQAAVETAAREARPATGGGAPGTKGAGGPAAPAPARGQGVGVLDPSCGFHVGIAPADARPLNAHAGMQRTAVQSRSDTHAESTSTVGVDSEWRGGAFDRNAAFLRYKKAVPEGQALAQDVQEKQGQMHAAKGVLTECASRVNAAKADIDRGAGELKAWELSQQMQDQADPDIVDGEMYRLLEALKNAKQEYRREFDQLKELRTAFDEHVQRVAEARQGLLQAFSSWCDTQVPPGGHPAGPRGGPGGRHGPAGDGAVDLEESLSELQMTGGGDLDSLPYQAAKRQARLQAAGRRPALRGHFIHA